MDFMLAEDWREGQVVAGYLMSEKLDGVRAAWDGSKIISRGGRTINAPGWWTKSLPQIAIDGELWAGRGRFEFVNAAQRRDVPVDAEWQEITFRAFDAPDVAGGFSERFAYLQTIPETEHFKIIEHRRCESVRDARALLRQVLSLGGEGVILRKPDAAYQPGRSSGFLRIKPVDNASATVTGYTKGAGKHAGRVGAIVCKTTAGIVFKIGTGLSDMVRERPPRIGRTITYQFRGLTKYGVPRHAALVA